MKDAPRFEDQPLDITLTEPAKERITAMLSGQSDKPYLRISVHGGGCGGMEYGFDLDDSRTDYDLLYEQPGIQIVVDALSYPYLAGSGLDFVDDLMGSKFIINNPNAKTTCGCGGSFSF